jgi:hypothetical protein
MRSPQHSALAMMSAVVFSAIPNGCATMTGSNAPIESQASFCAVGKPILWSARDSDATILQVKEHNAAGSVLCGWNQSGRSAPLRSSK